MKTTPDSMTNQIYKNLRMDILTGKIHSGTRLAELTIAEKIGVSRTPVREALRQLVKEDLLYAIPRAGYVVQELSELDIVDLFETRKSIELVAAQSALLHIGNEEIKMLENNLKKSEEIIEAGQTEKMIDLDTEFHHIIYKATRSKYLYRICMSLSDYTLKFRQSVIIVPEVAKRAKNDHYAIYMALKAKDSAKVEETISGHLKVVKKDILRYLEKLRTESFLAEDAWG